MTGPTESASPDLLIIGGGIHGCAAAFFAAKRGMSVTVLEKDSVARHASGVNAGGVRRLGRDFAEVPISVRSMEIWHEIGSLLDDETGFQIAPQIKVAENEAELAKLSERAEALEMQGFRHEVLLDRAQLRELLPAVADHAVGGLAVWMTASRNLRRRPHFGERPKSWALGLSSTLQPRGSNKTARVGWSRWPQGSFERQNCWSAPGPGLAHLPPSSAKMLRFGA